MVLIPYKAPKGHQPLIFIWLWKELEFLAKSLHMQITKDRGQRL